MYVCGGGKMKNACRLMDRGHMDTREENSLESLEKQECARANAPLCPMKAIQLGRRTTSWSYSEVFRGRAVTSWKRREVSTKGHGVHTTQTPTNTHTHTKGSLKVEGGPLVSGDRGTGERSASSVPALEPSSPRQETSSLFSSVSGSSGEQEEEAVEKGMKLTAQKKTKPRKATTLPDPKVQTTVSGCWAERRYHSVRILAPCGRSDFKSLSETLSLSLGSSAPSRGCNLLSSHSLLVTDKASSILIRSTATMPFRSIHQHPSSRLL